MFLNTKIYVANYYFPKNFKHKKLFSIKKKINFKKIIRIFLCIWLRLKVIKKNCTTSYILSNKVQELYALRHHLRLPQTTFR